MAQWIGDATSNATGVTKEYPVANGVTVTDGDFVYTNGGRVTSASIAGVNLLGLVSGKQSNRLDDHNETLTATGDVDGTVKVLTIVEPNAKYVIESDNLGVTLGPEHVGQRFDLTGDTGEQLVDSSTVGASGQLELVEFGYKGNPALGVFIIAEHKYKA